MLSDLDRNKCISVYGFKSADDSFDWMRGGDVIEKYGFDKYTFRALSSYIYEISSENDLNISERNNVVYIEMDASIPTQAQDDLINISLLSNFQVSRSEEHTSELQSRGHLVCRLLLEIKKIT